MPPTDVFVDVLPAVILFGIGITLVVAPLTTTLMGSVPVANAGLGSAINNAVSRVGSPLLMAMLYIVITAVFYGSLDKLAPSMDTGSNAVRAVGPAAQPTAGRHRSEHGRRHRPGLDRRLPDRDARRCRAAR